MNPNFHWDVKQNTEEWFRLRMGIPTASEFDRIITPTGKLSTQAPGYMNKLLWEYVSGVPLQEQEDMYQSPWMEHGHEYEEQTVKSFELMTGLVPEKCGFISAWDEIIGCSPDRIVRDVGCCEMKSPAPFTQIGYLLDQNALRDKYWVQVQGQMFVSDFNQQFLCSDNPKLPPVILKIERDEKFCALLALALRQFVDKMLEARLRLDKEFGLLPPVKKTTALAHDEAGELGVSMADVEAIIAAKKV
jgi:hypothetical protein